MPLNVFVSYSPTQKGYKCYHSPSRKWFVTIDVTFHESQSYFLDSIVPLQGEQRCEEIPILPMMIEVEMERSAGDSVVEGVGIEREDSREPEEEVVGGSKDSELKVYLRGTWSKRKSRMTSEASPTPPQPLPFSLRDEDSGDSGDPVVEGVEIEKERDSGELDEEVVDGLKENKLKVYSRGT